MDFWRVENKKEGEEKEGKGKKARWKEPLYPYICIWMIVNLFSVY